MITTVTIVANSPQESERHLTAILPLRMNLPADIAGDQRLELMEGVNLLEYSGKPESHLAVRFTGDRFVDEHKWQLLIRVLGDRLTDHAKKAYNEGERQRCQLGRVERRELSQRLHHSLMHAWV